jgi:hypothetical protein
MKKIILLLTLSFSLLNLVNAQTPPNAFNYSAVARNAAGQPIATSTISIQVSILKTSPTGVSQYSENHFVNTDSFGLFNLVIGAGAVQSGSMATIDWSNDNYYLKVGMDATGGTNFLSMGTTQLLSVPYAMYASKAGQSGRKNIDTLTLNVDYTVVLQPNNPIAFPTNGGPNYWLEFDFLTLNRDEVMHEFLRVYRNGIFYESYPNQLFSNSVLEIGYGTVTEPIGTVFTWKYYIETFDDIKFIEFSSTVQ